MSELEELVLGSSIAYADEPAAKTLRTHNSLFKFLKKLKVLKF